MRPTRFLCDLLLLLRNQLATEIRRVRREAPKSINDSDIASMNSKILLCHKLRQLGVSHDEYRRGYWYNTYHNHIMTGRAIAGVKVGITPGDFYEFPLDDLIEYSLDRNDHADQNDEDSGRIFRYYHPKNQEVEAFHHFIEEHILPDIRRATPAENGVIREVPEFFLDYTKIYRKYH